MGLSRVKKGWIHDDGREIATIRAGPGDTSRNEIPCDASVCNTLIKEIRKHVRRWWCWFVYLFVHSFIASDLVVWLQL